MTKLLMQVRCTKLVFLCAWVALFELFMGVISLYSWTQLSIEFTSKFRVTVSTGEDGWVISSFRNLGKLDPEIASNSGPVTMSGFTRRIDSCSRRSEKTMLPKRRGRGKHFAILESLYGVTEAPGKARRFRTSSFSSLHC